MQQNKRFFFRSAALSLAMAAALLASAGAQAKPEVVGYWLGTLKTGALSLRIAFNIADKAGALMATIDSPDQGVKGIPATSASLTGTELSLAVGNAGITYEGKLSADGKSISGYWSQGGQRLALDLARQEGPLVISRPQTPKPPYPYRSEEVAIAGKAPGVKLSGTLFIPAGKGPFPAVVFATGSGQQNRDEEIMGHKPFLVIADYLARRGIMSLRCDDRGIGGSTGEVMRATSLDFADDTQAELDWLSRRPEAKRSALGIVGHSEGGILAAIVASRDRAASFVVLLAGPGLKGEELLFAQGALIARAAGTPQAEIEKGQALNRRLYAAVKAADSEEEAQKAAKGIYLDWVEKSGEVAEADKAQARAMADSLMAQIASNWFRTFLSLDPATYLAKVQGPVLALNGSKDLQVPAKEDLAAIGAALKKERASGAAAKDKFVELDGLNHLFQHATSGSPAEYGTIEETFAPEALKAIGDWILSL